MAVAVIIIYNAKKEISADEEIFLVFNLVKFLKEKMYFVQEYRQVRDNGVSFKARGMFGYDTADQLYKLYWFDSLGYQPPAPASGLWVGDTLSLTRASMRGAARHIYSFDGDNAFRLVIDYSPDRGENWHNVLTGDYRRNTSSFPDQDS